MEIRQLQVDSHLEKNIAKLYLYGMVFRMVNIFTGILAPFGVGAAYFDIIWNGIGIVLALIRSKGKVRFVPGNRGKLLKTLIKLILWFNTSSLIMAIITQIIKGSYAGQSAFSGIFGMTLFYFQYIAIIVYNVYIGGMFTKNEIGNILESLSIFLLLLGYFQVFVVFFGGLLSIIDNLDIFGVLHTSFTTARVCLTASEPSNAAEILCILILPYLLSKAYIENAKKKYIVQIILWLPVVVFMQSSSAYLMFMACLVGLLLMNVVYRRTRKSIIAFSVITIVFILSAIIGLENILSFLLGFLPTSTNAKYLIMNKIFSATSNGSTTARVIPFYINWGAFKESPIIGVGNGLQGYYYNKYFPSFVYTVTDKNDAMRYYGIAQTSIVNGSLFLPSILSGYGIVGSILFILFCNKTGAVIKKNREKMGDMFPYFIISFMAIIVAAFKGDFAGKYYLLFVLSLPFIRFKDEVNNI